MKNNLENNFKESLNNFEVPYSEAAWTSMNTKLNEVMPTGSTGGMNFKWIAAISAVVITAASALYIYSPDEDTTNKSVQVSENDSTKRTSNNKKEFTTTTSNENDIQNRTTDQESVVLVPVTGDGDSQQTIDLESTDIELDEIIDNPQAIEVDQDVTNQNAGDKNPNESKSIILPSLRSICVGENIKIHNTNDVALTIEGGNNDVSIKPNSTKTQSFNKPGVYTIHSVNDNSETKTFVVEAG